MSDPSSLTEDQVAEWLSKQVGFPQYAALFKENDIDGSVLSALSESDLEKLGITSLGHRKKIAKAIENYTPLASPSAARVTQPKKTTSASSVTQPKKTTSASSSGPATTAPVASADSEEERLRKLREENEAKRKAKTSFMKGGAQPPKKDISSPSKFSPSKTTPKKGPAAFSPVPKALAVSDDSWKNKAQKMSGLSGGSSSVGSAIDSEQARLRRLELENRNKGARNRSFMSNSDDASWRNQEKKRVLAMEMQERQERMAAGKQSYMSVKVPLAAGAKSSIEGVASGSNNFVELIVDDSAKEISAGFAGTVSNSQFPNKLDKTNPRFALIKFSHVTQTGAPRTSTVFVYCCPSDSPKNMRMVYATAKPSLLAQIEQLGVSVDKSVEVNSAADLNEKSLVEELYFSGAAAYASHKAPEFDRHYIKNPHPLFGSKGRRGVDHNVVLAPAEAYGSSTHNQ